MAHNPWPEIIKRYLRTHDVSQKKLADRGDLSVQTINRWIRAKSSPGSKSIDKLAEGMHRPVEDLMWEYIRELDDHYRPQVPHLLQDGDKPSRPDLVEQAEALVARDLNGVWIDMKLALSGLRDAIRTAVSSHDASRALLESLVARYEDACDAALKRCGR